MPLVNCGGVMWSPELVGWGRPGPGVTTDLRGYYSGHLNSGTRGRVDVAQRANQTINFWNAPGIYALYKADTVVYVGQALAIGDRLLAHYRADHLVGRWDAFSWMSPAPIVETKDAAGRSVSISLGSVTGAPSSTSLDAWLTELEALSILIAKPVDNRQLPDLGTHMWWFVQDRSPHAEKTMEEMIAFLYAKAVKDAK